MSDQKVVSDIQARLNAKADGDLRAEIDKVLNPIYGLIGHYGKVPVPMPGKGWVDLDSGKVLVALNSALFNHLQERRRAEASASFVNEVLSVNREISRLEGIISGIESSVD